MKLAYLFPGQGAQTVGMGRALAERHARAAEVFTTADRVLGIPLSRICWEGPEAELKKTVHAQPALLTHSVAALRLLEGAGVRPSWVAGHSLGEYSACVAAGALAFEDALALVYRRGELMYLAGIERPGTMAAILGMTAPQVEQVCAEAGASGVVVAANLNAPGQVVISGEIAGVEKACEIAKANGARRAIRLEVSGAFHSPLMEAAAAGLSASLDATTFRDPSCPVVTNVAALPVTRGADLRESLKRQLMGAVRWEESMRWILAQSPEAFVEVGTGKVLRGLLRTVDPEARALGTDDPDALAASIAALGHPAWARGGVS